GFLEGHRAFLIVAAALGGGADAGGDDERPGAEFLAEAARFLPGADKAVDARGDSGARAKRDEFLRAEGGTAFREIAAVETREDGDREKFHRAPDRDRGGKDGGDAVKRAAVCAAAREVGDGAGD